MSRTEGVNRKNNNCHPRLFRALCLLSVLFNDIETLPVSPQFQHYYLNHTNKIKQDPLLYHYMEILATL